MSLQVFIHLSPGQRDGFGDIENALLNRESFVITGMGDQVVCANQNRPFHLSTKTVDRLLANDGGRSSQIDQVAVMDNEGMEIMLLTLPVQKLDLFGIGRLRSPHAGARGKDLERISAQLGGLDCSPFERARGGRMDTNTQFSE